MSETLPVLTDPSETTRVLLAFESALPAIQAVPEDALLPITVDVPNTVTTVLGAVKRLRAYEAELSRLTFADPVLMARLEPYALALFEAHARYVVATRPVMPIAELVAVGMKERSLLYDDAVALSNRGLFDPKVLDQYKGTSGHRQLAVDLQILRNELRRDWARIEGRTGVTKEQLDRVDMVIEQLLSAIGERDLQPATIASASLLRQKAFTLLARTYDAVRRGVHYLRWNEDDGDTITPSLYAGRAGKRKPVEAEGEAPAPATPAPTAASGS